MHSHGDNPGTDRSCSLVENEMDLVDHWDEYIVVAMAQARTLGYLVSSGRDLQREAKASLEQILA